ncbi:arsenical pump membrane protein [Enhydrobacter aerosaccus SK60]|nr:MULTISPECIES: arsenic transporter [Moraxella]EEV23008.1 arsenical pump membrane protein [Enhydrobacter aerosaccus SK60]NOX78824.1 arsenic transporter [Gammaproteobacteria bacterium]MBL7668582.1 arsenic transporter [Moraxella osloensis]MDI4481577.1 arsenic transporter [Moraxella osloensis]NPA78616.1 arsenic transporter [Gammaproteobacteria bacterium]
MAIAAIIFLLTLIFVIWQPKGLGIGWTATIGAMLALMTGVIGMDDIPVVWDIVWNATFAFIAIIIISLLLDEAGFFKWIALHVARFAKGNGHWLFAFIVLLGAVVSAFFANDGAALILTPIVIAILLALRFSPATTLAFIMAAGFIADTASLPLVVSNLVNIVSADFFKVPFDRYALVMVPVNLVSVLASLVVLYGFYRKDIPNAYALEWVDEPNSAITDKATFTTGWVVLAALLFGFFVFEPMGVPISVIAGLGAAVLLAVATMGKKLPILPVVKNAPWQIVIFSLGMYLVVYGLKNAGLTDYLATLLQGLEQQGLLVATVGTGFLSAILSSVMNNMPTVLIQALAIDGAHITSPMIKEAMVFANVIGCDLGPKITPIGSLATLLWLHVLATKNIKVSWGYYFKVGMILTIPVLLATLVALVGWLSLIN